MKKDFLVAASAGPYGSASQKGEEYDGRWEKDLGAEWLADFHRTKFEVFVDRTNADIIGYETIPCLTECEAIIKLLQTRPGSKAWIAVTCKDVNTLCSGESFEDFVKLVERLDTHGQVEAIGPNCAPPEYVSEQIKMIRKHSQKTIIIYPNNGYYRIK